MFRRIFHKHPRTPGQAIVEFALALPVLLLLLFGVIEFGRLLQAWLTVQNAARFGLRFAVTGEFYPSYCDDAAIALDLEDEDTFNGDPAGDCIVPEAFGDTSQELTDAMVDWARMPSTRDNARVGATGIPLNEAPAVSGNYISYLISHNFADLGFPDQRGYFHVTVCSSRDRNEDGVSDFALDEDTNPDTCFDLANDEYTDDAGGPGDRVRVIVSYMHPMILPFITQIWPELPLTAWREGIVERFRTSRVSGLGGQIVNAPTRTPPTPPTPTDTEVPPTPTNTPVTPTPTPDCSLYTIGNFSFVNGAAHPDYAQLQINITNNSSSPVGVESMSYDWSYAEQVGELRNYDDMVMDWIRWNEADAWNGHDYDSPTDTTVDSPDTWTGPLPLPATSSGQLKFDIDNNWADFETSGMVIPNDFGLFVMLDNGCPLNRPPVVRPLPQPNCALYSMTNFTFLNYGNLQMNVTNGDVLAARITRIRMDWNYAENLTTALGDTSLRMDWYQFSQWGGVNVWGNGDNAAVDYNSITDTSVDSPETWTGPLDFNPATAYIFRLDMDKNSESPSNWMVALGMINNDFGVTIDFDNGCQLNRAAVPRAIITPTPSCALITAIDSRIDGDDFEIRVRNGNFAPAYLTFSTLTWPTNWSPSMYFDYFRFQGNRYYDVNSYSSPVSAAAPRITLPGNTAAWWESDFENYPAAITQEGCFNGVLTFDFSGLVCTVSRQLCVVPTPTPTLTPYYTRTPTPVITLTFTPAPTLTRTPTPNYTVTATQTRTATQQNEPTSTSTTTVLRTNTPTSTSTSAFVTPTRTATPTPTPTTNASPTVTQTPCLTPPDLGGCN
ncbi:MAG: pilus assembly protein [Chloroflexi bacterium]|nr:pilus assembly protein [Chloroflexota bacterium]